MICLQLVFYTKIKNLSYYNIVVRQKSNKKGREYYTSFLTNFKYTNFNLNKLTFRQVGTTIYVDAYYIL